MRNSKGQFIKGITPWNKGKEWTEMKGNKFCVGRKPWNKGIKAPQISLAKMGKKRPDMIGNIFRNSVPGPNKGKKLTEEQKNKLDLSGLEKGRGWNKGISATWATGEKNSQWKGGVSTENEKIRRSRIFKEWGKAVLTRDDFTDQKTKIKGGKLCPHHIFNFAEYPELRFELNNGITLSDKTHREFHKKYGFTHNTQKQLMEFLNN